jgi:hydrogenase-4 component B
MYQDEPGANRRAAYLYLLVSHVGAIAILFTFGIMAALKRGRVVIDSPLSRRPAG